MKHDPILTDLAIALHIMHGEPVLRIPPGGWPLAEIADLAGLAGPAIVAAVHRAVDMPALAPACRIDRVCAFLSARALTPVGGWSTPALAEFCQVPERAINKRITAALATARAHALTL